MLNKIRRYFLTNRRLRAALAEMEDKYNELLWQKYDDFVRQCREEGLL